MDVRVQLIGGDKVEAVLRRSAVNTRNAAPAFDRIATYLMRITEKQFESQGRRGGGSWARLTPAWAQRKVALGGDPRILHFTGALRRSVTTRKARGQILVVQRDSLQFGSELEYAAVHQRGHTAMNIPARPYLKLLTIDRRAIGSLISEHVMDSWGRKSPTPILRRR
jgi:phage gpG-like protein